MGYAARAWLAFVFLAVLSFHPAIGGEKKDPLLPLYLQALKTGTEEQQIAVLERFGEYKQDKITPEIIRGIADSLERSRATAVRTAAVNAINQIWKSGKGNVEEFVPGLLSIIRYDKGMLRASAADAI